MKNYDAIIIGSGIGGLVCGNYLAKKGMQILIVEQHSRPGGYCCSITRQGFSFDMGVFAIGGLGKKGFLRRILTDIGVLDKMDFIRFDPLLKIVTPDFSATVRENIQDTIDGLQELFPHQAKEIEKFLSAISAESVSISGERLIRRSFKELMLDYFTDEKLMMVLEICTLGLGLPAKLGSALDAVNFLRNFVLGGVYYPRGGAQALPDQLLKSFRAFGGEILFNKRVSKIVMEGEKAIGIEVEGEILKAKYIVSNADARQTFLNLVGKEHISSSFLNNLLSSTVSHSGFLAYFGINRNLKKELSDHCIHYYFPSSFESLFPSTLESLGKENGYLMAAFPSFHDLNQAPSGSESVCLMVSAPYSADESFWENNREKFAEILLRRAKLILPDFSKNIVFRETATPRTFYDYTLNSEGAIYGWNPTVDLNRIKNISPINNLYLAGHWTRPGLGVATVAASGFMTAKLILMEHNNKL